MKKTRKILFVLLIILAAVVIAIMLGAPEFIRDRVIPSFNDFAEDVKTSMNAGKDGNFSDGTIQGTISSISDTASALAQGISDSIEGISDRDRSAELVEAPLIKVVDGDTIRVTLDGTDQRVRLLSVNAEESVHEDESRNNECGRRASAYLKELLKDTKTVWLEYDDERTDIYGRQLCYVWLSGKVDTTSEKDARKEMLNAVLLRDGYVYTAFYYDRNKRYRAFFEELQKESESEGAGLWNEPDFRSGAETEAEWSSN